MTWHDFIDQELKASYFQDLIMYLKDEDQKHTVFPLKNDRLNAFKLTPYDTVKVVIIGQDPYHNINQAHGLAFSVLGNTYPPSLKNIYKELCDDLQIPYPNTGNLTPWAKQGVLLLNTTLTVRAHEPMSHQGHGWEIFTKKVMMTLNEINRPIAFILWGKHATQFIPLLNNPNHLILKAPHPSPLSAHRGFFGSKPFSKANAFLKSKGIKPIDWSL
ncbi:MAG: uracil-DNA glycosylase [Acholeplasmataceae bacterium]